MNPREGQRVPPASRADLVVDGAIVITMDRERRIFSEGAMAIGGDRILAVGKSSEVGSRFQAMDRIDARGHVALPGLINAHSHFFPLLRGAIPEHHAADTVRRHYLYPFFRDLSAEEETIGAKVRMWEMIRTGTTCFADGGCKHLYPLVRAVEEMGLRGVLGRWRCDRGEKSGGAESYGIQTTTAKALEELAEELRQQASSRVRISATLVEDRVVSDALLLGAKELAQRYGTLVSVDVATTKDAVEEAFREDGRRPVRRLREIGALGPRVLLNHATDLDAEEVRVIAETGSPVCWTPGAALRRGHGTTQSGKVPELVKAGATVALGTDGPASSDYADLIRVLYLAATLPKDARLDHGAMSAESALEMATLHGARALGLEKEIGSLEVGKKADLILMDTQRPEWRPLFHVVNNLVFSASGDSVRTAIVDGQVLMRDGRLVVADEAELLEGARAIRRGIWQRLRHYPS